LAITDTWFYGPFPSSQPFIQEKSLGKPTIFLGTTMFDVLSLRRRSEAEQHQTLQLLLLHGSLSLLKPFPWIKQRKLIIWIYLLPSIKIDLPSDLCAAFNIAILAIFAWDFEPPTR
jgi:hypothetical protein